MASEDKFQGSSSQESLPLSQGSFSVLVSQLNPCFQDLPNIESEAAHFTSDILPESHAWYSQLYTPASSTFDQSSNISTVIPVPVLPREPSSLPASEIWPGKYSFQLFFNEQENTKGATWIYWEQKNKLFISKDAPCSFNFSASTLIPGEDLHIRAMALFNSPAHATEIVHRCINHSMEETIKGMVEAEHFIRCESRMSSYEVDPATGRHSVVVPFEDPPAGQYFSSYIYKFACFGSCAGGPNRRPMMLVFTLEKGTQVIGRCKVELKVCAGPLRDKKQEEKQLLPKESVSVKRTEPSFDASTLMPDLIPTKKSKLSPPATENGYCIWVQDRACYKFLQQMKRLYCIYTAMRLKSTKPFPYLSLTSSEDEPTL